jgi:hypothetical protein
MTRPKGRHDRIRHASVEITAAFEGRFVYRVRCSYHGTVETTTDYARIEAAKVEHLIEHDLLLTETDP